MNRCMRLNCKTDTVILEKSLYALLLMAIFVMFPDVMLAAQGNTKATPKTNAIATVICNVVGAVTGPIGQGVATVAVVFVSLGFFMGKTSMGILLATGVGIGMLFGAETIVNMVSGGSGSGCAGMTGDVTGKTP